MELIAGFLNDDKNSCTCDNCYYVLPIKQGDIFYIIIKNEDTPPNIEGITYVLEATYADYKVYKFTATAALPSDIQIQFGGQARPISALCDVTIAEMCDWTIAEMCTYPQVFGCTCFRYNDCDDSILEWQQKYSWYPLNSGYFQFKQRLPIRIHKPLPKTDGVDSYQKSNGEVVKTGKTSRYYEYVMEIDHLPFAFHRQLEELLQSAVNLKINGKDIIFGGDYVIDWQNKNDCFAKATCKIIQKINSVTSNCV